jgi:hypothetical protein
MLLRIWRKGNPSTLLEGMYICQIFFYSCVRYLIRNNLKEESFTLAHGFRGFGLWSPHYIALEPVVRPPHHGGEHSSSLHGRQKSKKEIGRGRATQYPPSRTCPQWPNFLPLGPASYMSQHFPTVPQAGDQAFNKGLWGDTADPHYSSRREWVSPLPLCSV